MIFDIDNQAVTLDSGDMKSTIIHIEHTASCVLAFGWIDEHGPSIVAIGDTEWPNGQPHQKVERDVVAEFWNLWDSGTKLVGYGLEESIPFMVERSSVLSLCRDEPVSGRRVVDLKEQDVTLPQACKAAGLGEKVINRRDFETLLAEDRRFARDSFAYDLKATDMLAKKLAVVMAHGGQRKGAGRKTTGRKAYLLRMRPRTMKALKSVAKPKPVGEFLDDSYGL